MASCRHLAPAACALALAGLLAPHARGQCLDWSDDFGIPGFDQTAFASTVFDDGLGGGPALIVGGKFSVPGSVLARGVARWTGSEWQPLGSGFDGVVRALTVFDDGTGPALYVGGAFATAGGQPAAGIARWDGVGWSPVGSGFDGVVRALTVFDDGLGGGPCLIAGGLFSSADGRPARNLARWDGTRWTELGGGTPGQNTCVYDLVVHDDGSGPALFVGGEFGQVGKLPAANVARWDGSSWSALGTGTSASVRALAVCDLGSGADLYAGGEFLQAGGTNASRIARWDGAGWAPLGPGVDGTIRSLGVHDDGGGSALYVGGQFTTAGGSPASRIARWDSGGWSPLGTGLGGGMAWGITSFTQPGQGSRLAVCGEFETAGATVAVRIAAWDGSGWSAMGAGEGLAIGSDEGVNAFAEFDDGSGPALYAGGTFTRAGGALMQGVGLARWDGSTWNAISPPLNPYGRPLSMAVFDPGTGPGLFVGWTGSGVRMWNGTGWDPSQAIGTHSYMSSSSVAALVVHDDGSGPALYAGGPFEDACSPSVGSFLVRWDGQACASVGTAPAPIQALLSFDDGSGSALYAGCGWAPWPSSPGSMWRWDGVAWTQLGGDPGGVVYALVGFDDGSGPAVYAGGEFGVLRWDGAAWIPIGTGDVRALAVHDDGTAGGAALYATGRFDAQGSVPAASIARWDGVEWTPLGLGIETGDWDTGSALLSYDDGSGRKLWVGGSFHVAGGRPSVGIARWGDACGCTGTPYCTAKTSSAGCVPSMGSSGITNLTASQPFTLFATQVLNNKYGLLFYGTSGADSKPFLGGTLCARSPIRRTPVQWSGGNPPPDDCSGMFSMDFKAYALGGADPALVAGASVFAQYWYRDPADAYGSSTTDAVAFTLCP